MTHRYQRVWFIITLSALAYSLAFFLPNYCGFLAPLAVVATVFLPATFARGFCWGLLVYGSHFIWLVVACYKHTSLGIAIAVVCYAVTVIYCALTAGAWFWGMRRFSRMWQKMVLTMGYWYVVDRWLFVPLGLGIGYPLCSPLLPLFAHKPFLQLLGLSITLASPHQIGHVRPVVNRDHDWYASWANDATAVWQRTMAVMQQLQAPLLVAPESAYPFALNDYEGLVQTMTLHNTDQQHVVLCGSLRKGDQFYQVAYHVQRRLIIEYYVKKMLVPLAETPPPLWQWVIGKAMVPGFMPCSAGDDGLGVETFTINGQVIIPRICLEFFLAEADEFIVHRYNPKAVVFALVNDSWYVPYVRRLMVLLALKKSHEIRLPVVYIGHFDCYTIGH